MYQMLTKGVVGPEDLRLRFRDLIAVIVQHPEFEPLYIARDITGANACEPTP